MPCLGDSASSFTMQQASMSGRDADSPCTNCNGVSRALLKAYSWSLTDPIKLLSTNGGGISDKFKVQDVSLELRVNLVRISRWDGSRVYLLVQLKWLPVQHSNVEFSLESLNSRFSFFLHNSENEDLLYKEEDCNHRFVSNSSDLGFTIFVPLEFENTYKKSDSQNTNFLSYEIRLCFISFGLDCVNLASPNHREMPISLRSCGFRMLTIISSSLVYLYHFQIIRSLLQQLPTMSVLVEDSLIAAVQKIFVDMELLTSQGGTPSGPQFETIDIMNVFEAYGLALTDLDRVENCADFLREFLARLGRYCETEGGPNPLDGVFFGNYRYFTLGVYTRMRKFDCFYLDIVTTDDIYQALNNACMRSEEPPIQSSSNLGSTSRTTEFHSFPLVLHLVLKRFKFDAMQGKEIKLMTYFEVPNVLEIDHTTFHSLLPTTSDNSSGSSLYKLFLVVAHEGTSGKNGHYMTYVRSDGQSWKRIASQMNSVPDDHLKETASRSACFLTYIRQSEWNQLIV